MIKIKMIEILGDQNQYFKLEGPISPTLYFRVNKIIFKFKILEDFWGKGKRKT